MRSHVLLILACIALASISPARLAGAEEFVQRGVNEHGRVTINVALDKKQLVIELESPAVNVIGFEHEPRTGAERAVVREVSSWFKSGRALFGLPSPARCSFRQADLSTPQWEQDGDEAEAPGAHHADYIVRFTYQCEAAEKLSWLEPWLVDKLRSVVRVRVNIAAPSGQRSETVPSGHTRVVLQ
jgi:Protein of unknown function (DUF2796)